MSQEDSFLAELDTVQRGIKSSNKTHYYKCLNCPYLGSCFVNSEIRYIDQTKKHALRQSVNTIVQGSSADMTSLALIGITDELERRELKSTPVLMIHDEIGCLTHKDYVEETTSIMEYYMTAYLAKLTGFSVPLITDTKIVKCWGDK
jgi:DNA polymerase I-like protein with 3'-5' exonuclease and polymerase domains